MPKYITVLYILVFFLAAKPVCAQRNIPSLPFSVTKGAKGVVVHTIHYTNSSPTSTPGTQADTNEVFYFNKDGYAISKSRKTHKYRYEYQNQNLCKEIYYSGARDYYILSKQEEQQLNRFSEHIYEYDNEGRILSQKWVSDTIVNSVTKYFYNFQGLLIKKIYNEKHSSYDSLTIEYHDDTAFNYHWSKGQKVKNNSFCLERYNKANRLLYSRTYMINKSDSDCHYYTYNESGLLSQYENKSSRPVESNGVVLRSDKVVYEYNSKGWLIKQIHYASGKKVWEYTYTYF